MNKFLLTLAAVFACTACAQKKMNMETFPISVTYFSIIETTAKVLPWVKMS